MAKSDKEQDKKTMKGMTPAQKAKFKKEDSKMDRDKMSRAEDTKKDDKLAAKIKGCTCGKCASCRAKKNK